MRHQSSGSLQLSLKVIDHYVHHFLKAHFGLPPPILSSLAVVNAVWPRVCNFLPVIRLVVHLDRDAFIHSGCQFLGSEGKSAHVVARPDLDLLLVCLHNLDGSFDDIIHIDHWQSCLLRDKTSVMAPINCAMEDINGVVSGSTSRLLLPADDPWISQTPDIQSKLQEIVLRQELTRAFCDSVHGHRLDDSILGRIHLRRGRPKGSNRTRPKYFLNLQFYAKIEYALQRVQVDVPSEVWIFLACN